MDSIQLVRRLHGHRRWVNAKLLDVAQQLSREQLHHSFPMGQGSIWKSLTHLYAGEYVWLATLQGNENPLASGDVPDALPGNQLGENAVSCLTELQGRWSDLEEAWNRYLHTLHAESLDDTVYKISSLSKQRFGTRRGDILLHVCTHAHYTTAQIINMMRHVGAPQLPDPMLITLAREETASRS